MAVPSPKSGRKPRSAALSLSLKQSAPAMSMPGDPPELGLAQTVADFTRQIATAHQRYANHVQSIVDNFKERTIVAKNGRVRENNVLFCAWDMLLDEYDSSSQEFYDISNVLEAQIAVMLFQALNQKKELLQNVSSYRETFHQQMWKGAGSLEKTEKEFCDAWKRMSRDGMDNIKNYNTALCHNKHNDYVLELASVNQYNAGVCGSALPKINSEIDGIHGDLIEVTSQGVSKHAKILQAKFAEQSRRMEAVVNFSRRITPAEVLGDSSSLMSEKEPRQYSFAKPEQTAQGDLMQNKLVLNSATEQVLNDRYDGIVKEIREHEADMSISKDLIAKLKRQYDSVKSNTSMSNSKAANTLAEIYRLRNQLRKHEVSLASKRAQIQLFAPDWFKSRMTNGHANGAGGKPEENTDQALSSEATDSVSDMIGSGNAPQSHSFLEHTFKKPTFCEQCRGYCIMKQGLRCKHCKMSIHKGCEENIKEQCKGTAMENKPNRIFRRQSSVQIQQIRPLENKSWMFKRPVKRRELRSLPDKKKLLRRQKSSSEIETPTKPLDSHIVPKEIDPIYEAIKCAASLSTINDLSRTSSVASLACATAHAMSPVPALDKSHLSPAGRGSSPEPVKVAKSAPHSPNSSSQRRKVLQMYGKSMSLDTEPAPREVMTTSRRSEPSVNKSHFRRSWHFDNSSAALDSPDSSPRSNPHYFSPVYHRKGRMVAHAPPGSYIGRVTKGRFQIAKELQVPNVKECIALYDFEGMMRDDLSLRAGDRVAVLDDKSSDWWKGQCKGRIGFFPSFCVTMLQPWERVVKVTHTFKAGQELKDGLALRKDQIVIQLSKEENGWVTVRTGKKTGQYPYCYLQPTSSNSKSEVTG
ncbi:LOW QUALITY PROTEIN: uncharacterized protein [Amphiura filiformis]|uniref:LOW QUALITY PROTEIN: uncharacterized protein n=1 Tax=Amphiura filiformis TaxID=82378 RepID=UPI003B21FE73